MECQHIFRPNLEKNVYKMEADGYTYKVRKKQREVESHDDVKRQSKSTIEPIQPVEEFVSFLNLCLSSTLISEYQDIRSSP